MPAAWDQLPPAAEFPTDSSVLGDCLIGYCCQQYQPSADVGEVK